MPRAYLVALVHGSLIHCFKNAALRTNGKKRRHTSSRTFGTEQKTWCCQRMQREMGWGSILLSPHRGLGSLPNPHCFGRTARGGKYLGVVSTPLVKPMMMVTSRLGLKGCSNCVWANVFSPIKATALSCSMRWKTFSLG